MIFIPFVLLLLHWTTSVVPLRHSQCATSALTVRGVDIVSASKNTVLVVAFMPLQCAFCHRQLKRLSHLATGQNDVRVVVLAPSYEAPVTISRIQAEFPRLVIDRDVHDVWRSYEAANHDQIFFDKCGRVSQVVSQPRSDMTNHRDTLNAVDSARAQRRCGPCAQGGSREAAGNAKTSHKTIKVKNASVQQRLADPGHYNEEQQRGRPSLNIRANYNTRAPPIGNAGRPTTTFTQPPVNRQDYGSAQNYQATTTATTPYPQWNRQFNAQQSEPTYRAPYGGEQNSNNYQSPPFDYHQRTSLGSYSPTFAPASAPASTSARHDLPAAQQTYGPDEDYEEDALPPQMTTPAVQTQIPTPTSFDPLWPTPAPGEFFQSDPRNSKKVDPRFTKYGEQASENNIPCSAYTDDICYQQQEKLGREGLSKCCTSGIYLTDVCMPGKCSNNTIQLCCFQKFLQARYRCCEDDSQSIGPASTMDFSMCCYRNFVTEDDCCSAETASGYWRSVHEVCYPNTKVDYSNINMEVRFAEGVRVVNLNENRVWDYECRNGVNRTQYAYLP